MNKQIAIIIAIVNLILLQINFKSADAASWHGWTEPLAPAATSIPECTVWGSRISCWYLDTTKSVIWLASMDSDWTGPLNWFGAVDLEGNIRSALSCTLQNARLMSCFGVGSDKHLYENVYREQGPIVWWTDWVSRSGSLVFSPSCVLWGASGIECFASGTDKALYEFSFDGLIWKAPRKLGGTSTTPPSCHNLNGGINCFIVNNVGNIQWRRFAGTWGLWKNIGGSMSGTPECVSVSGGIRCIARDRSGVLRYSTFNGSVWTSWQSLGLVTATQPECLKPTPTSSVIECFGVTSSGTLVRKRFNGIVWEQAQNLGGQINGRPSCVAPTSNRIDCVARGKANGNPQHISYY